jgi:hypothetical protein
LLLAERGAAIAQFDDMSAKNRVAAAAAAICSHAPPTATSPADKPATETDIDRRFGRKLPAKLRFA